jgi:hypothetical protein
MKRRRWQQQPADGLARLPGPTLAPVLAMPWLFFALSAVCFAIAFRTLSLGVAAVCLLLALGLLLAGALGLASARIQRRAQSAAAMLGPEQAAIIGRRAAAKTAPPPAGDAGEPNGSR